MLRPTPSSNESSLPAKGKPQKIAQNDALHTSLSLPHSKRGPPRAPNTPLLFKSLVVNTSAPPIREVVVLVVVAAGAHEGRPVFFEGGDEAVEE